MISKTPGELIDSLITVVVKCFFSQEKLMDTTLSESDRLKAAVNSQELNAKRNTLIRALDEFLGQSEFSPTAKTYSDGEINEEDTLPK